MNEKLISQFLRFLCFTFLIILTTTCSTQSQSNQDVQKIEANKKNSLIFNELETVGFLKYSSGIRSILEDSKGNIWFGSHQEGVCLFDGKTMTYFTKEDGLSDNQIRSIYEDSNGVVWFEGGEGISSYDSRSPALNVLGKKITTSTTKNYSSTNEWKIGENDLWFKGDESSGFNGTEGGFGVYRYDGSTLNFHAFPITFEKSDNFTYSVSTPFVKGKNGMVWFGTYGAAFGYDGKSFTTIESKGLGLNEETGYLHIRSIYEDTKGRLWIGNNGIGVLLYDGDTTINFSQSQGLIPENSGYRGGHSSPPGSLEHVFSIGEDNDGNIWFGDRDTGAWKYDGKSMKNYTKKDGLTITHIWQIYNSKNGELWFAMSDGKVLKFNGESFERKF